MSSWSSATECLVPLHRSGHGRSLFCVHPSSGTVGVFAPIAARLADVRDVFGLQCHGISPGHESDQTIEAMADRYVEAVVAAQPRGPYEIVGYSMGGLVAVEMARRLHDRGERVTLTGALDTAPPGVPLPRMSTAAALGLVSRAIGLNPPFAGDESRPDEVLIDDFRTAAVRAGVLPAAFRQEDLRPMVDIYAVNGHAGDVYQPEPYTGGVRCLFANHDSADNYADEWRRYATGKVTIDVVEADHFSLMHEQNAAHVANVLTSWLSEP